jgi:hypothetical protein
LVFAASMPAQVADAGLLGGPARDPCPVVGGGQRPDS